MVAIEIFLFNEHELLAINDNANPSIYFLFNISNHHNHHQQQQQRRRQRQQQQQQQKQMLNYNSVYL